MSDRPWTPGPWQADDGDCGLWGVFEEGNGAEIGYCAVPVTPMSPLRPEDEANARLIAAAPELAEALEQLLLQHKGGADRRKGQCCLAADAAIDALAKARGQ